MKFRIKEIIRKIENSRYLNWKTLLVFYLITRILIVLLLNYGSWHGESMLCYTADCKMYWHNVQSVVQGLNPYKVWMELGGYSLPIPLRTDWLPFFLILTSTFVWFWKSILAMRLVFFIFDLFNIVLIYKLAKFKKITSLLYILCPLIWRALLFPEDEIIAIGFVLASIYFFYKKRYSLSTSMLALSTNIKFFPVLLFPFLLLNITKGKINFKIFAKQIGIFTLVTFFWHLFWFPDWYKVYEFRIFYYTLSAAEGIWRIFSTDYYTPLLIVLFISLYFYTYFKKIDLKTGYLLGSLIFISISPNLSLDHVILLIPLFLIWSRLNLLDILLWIFLSIGVVIEFLGLPTIGFIAPLQREVIGVLILIGFYLTVGYNFKIFLKKNKENNK